MRNDDLSQSGNHPTANDDYDVIPAGSGNSATGNTITGRGTVSGAAGADEAGSGGHITSISGAGSADGASMEAAGRYGAIKIDAQGNYSYTRANGGPDNVEDVFTYTLADKAGAIDSARLIIRIEGKEDLAKIQDGAQRIVAGNEVITLPAGVELSDIHVVGRDLVIDLPDGTQMVITDGAVFVPQLALGDVELPADTLAQLLIDSEPRPAAGPPQSSGGNFGEPVAPLDPGVPLGDLIPPTELGYTPPEFDETYIPQRPNNPDFIPDIFIQPDGQPASAAAVDQVDEGALPARSGEPAGSHSASTAEATSGNIVFTSPDGIASIVLTINGVDYVVYGTGAVANIPGDYGTLHINSVNIAAGTINYTYTLADNVNHATDTTPWEDFGVRLVDNDGDVATATLRINIVDDVPTAVADVDSVTEDGATIADGNVFTGVGGTDANATDGVADIQGADGAHVTGVAFGGVAGALGSALNGTYGSLVLSASGGYVYTLNNASLAVQGLKAGETRTDVFTYTITDGDGDTSTTTLTITVIGSNDRPIVVSGATSVSEEGLLAGNPDGLGNPTDSGNSATSTGTLSISDVDGDALTVTLGAPAGNFTSHGALITWAVSADGHTLTGSANGGSVIVVSIDNAGHYTVNLLGQIDHPIAGTSPATSEDIVSLVIPVNANDGTVTVGGTLTVSVEDDSPIISGPVTLSAAIDIDESNSGTPTLSPAGAITVTSSGAIIAAPVSYGGDGPGGAPAYSISLNGAVGGMVASGLMTADGDHPITLVQVDSTHINGMFNDGTDKVAFSITINANGTMTVTLNYALEHSDDGNTPIAYNDTNSPLTLAGLVSAQVTYEDFDHDTVTARADIGQLIRFFDDGPSVSGTVNGQGAVVLDETATSSLASTIVLSGIVKGDDPDVAGTGAIARAVGGTSIVNATALYGADGPGGALSYVLTIQDASSGLKVTDGSAINLVMNGNVIVGVVSGGAFDGQAAFAIAIDPATGALTVEQYLSLQHPVMTNPDDPVSMLAGHIGVVVTATDADGDYANSAAIDISNQITFRDDGPSVSGTVNGQGSVVLDETATSSLASTIVLTGITKGDDPDVAGTGAIARAVGTASIVNAAALYGADGQGAALSYILSIQNATSGLKVTDGSSINLVMNGNVIVGVVSGGAFDGQAAFAIAIDAATGALTVEQYLSLQHPVMTNPDDPVSMLAGHISVTVAATDGDGDTAMSAAIDISNQVTFRDDGPSVSATANGQGSVTLDETATTSLASTISLTIAKGDDLDVAGTGAIARAVGTNGIVNVNALYGADGPGAALSYMLSIQNANSGLKITDGSAIVLQMDGNVLVGVVAAGAYAGQAAFAIAIDATTGILTVEQYLSLQHPDVTNPDDPVSMLAGHIGVMVTATDGDGDQASSTVVDISTAITFEDDGPTIGGNLSSGGGVTLDESATGSLASLFTLTVPIGDDPDVGGVGAIARAVGNSSIASWTAAYGADGQGAALNFALSIQNAMSGLKVTDGSAIVLQMDGNLIVGVVAGGAFAGQAAFAIGINAATGVLMVEQYLSLQHPDMTNPDDPISMLAGHIGVTITATDGDGDTATTPVIDISGSITFEDDGPSVSGTLNGQGSVLLDETATSSLASTITLTIPKGDDLDVSGTGAIARAVGATSIVNANALYGADGPGAALSYMLSIQDANSGLKITDGSAIVLQMDGNVLVGVVAAGAYAGQAAFAIAIDPVTGILTVEQYLSLQHPDATNPDDPVSMLAGHIGVLVTATDGDGDKATSTVVDISAAITFEDDGPTAMADSVTQLLENQAFTMDLLANDKFGADGVDISNGAKVFVSAQATLGTVTYDTVTHLFTYTPNAGAGSNATSDSFSYTIVDKDGDSSTVTVTVTLTPDSVPQVVNVVAAVDDDGLAGGNPLSTIGDINANAGEPGATPSEAIYTGQINVNFGSDTGTVSFANLGGTTGMVGTESVAYTWNAGSNTLTATVNAGARSGTVLYTVSLSPSGAYTVTLVNPIMHPVQTAPGDETSTSVVLNYRAADSDGDVNTSGTLTITFNDDAPTAVNDTATQANENAAFNIFALGNDAFGADGVDINDPTKVFVSGQATQGVVTYDTVNHLFVYTPNAGAGSTSTTDSFTYTIIDRDGDVSTATVTITLKPDSVPQVVNVVAAVDDDGLAGGNPLSTIGDINANAGEPGATPSEAIYTGQINVNFGSDTGTVSFANLGGTTGMVGTESVAYTWNAGSNTLTATVNAGARSGTVLYTVSLSPSGAYTVTLVNPIMHPVQTAPGDETSTSVVLNYRAADSDGDVNTSGTLTITFNDDAPTAVNDTATQANENAAFNIFALGNDAFGADGVDINDPTKVFVSGQATQGVVTYDTVNHLFVYTPNAGAGSTSTTDSFTYTIIDRDGDVSTATVTITLKPDSVPQVVNVVAAVDDDGLAGGNPLSTIGDINANAGEPGATPSEAIYTGQINVNFGSDTGTVSFANLGGTTGMVGTESVAYTWNAGSNTLTATVNAGARSGTVLYTVSLSPSGAYTVTLVNPIMHPVQTAPGDETSTSVVLNYRAADSDGDVNTSGTLTITFNDDAPTAVNDTATQANENAAFNIFALGNDAFGADGVDINDPTKVFVSGQATQGVVTYDTVNHLFVYTPNAGAGSTSTTDSFTYTIIDRDGDVSTATVTITLKPDSVPVAGSVFATVDDEGLAGGIAGGTGDINANLGDLDQTSEAIFKGVLAGTSVDPIGSFLFQSSLTGTTQVMGQETVQYTVSGDGLTLTAKIIASPDASRINTNLFKVEITNAATGAYTVTLLDNVLHPAGGNENDVDISIAYQLRDSDGDLSASPGTLNIKFDDDMPAPYTTAPIAVSGTNAIGTTETHSLNLPSVGADGGAAIFTQTSGQVYDASNNILTDAGGSKLHYQLNALDPTILEARNEGGTLVFQVDINGSNYTYTQYQQIAQSVYQPIANLSSIGGGNTGSRAIDVTNSAFDLWISGNGTINTNQNYMGIGGGQSLQNGDQIRVDFITVTNNGGTASYNEYYGVASYRQDVGGLNSQQFANFKVYAIKVNEAPGSSLSDPADGDGVFYGDTNDTILTSGVSLNIYDGSGNLVNPANYATYQIVVTSSGGVFTVTHLPNNFDFEIVSTGGTFNAVEVDAIAGSSTFKLGAIAISAFGVKAVDLNVPVALVDADGDSVSNAIAIHLGAPAPTTAMVADPLGVVDDGTHLASSNDNGALTSKLYSSTLDQTSLRVDDAQRLSASTTTASLLAVAAGALATSDAAAAATDDHATTDVAPDLQAMVGPSDELVVNVDDTGPATEIALDSDTSGAPTADTSAHHNAVVAEESNVAVSLPQGDEDAGVAPTPSDDSPVPQSTPDVEVAPMTVAAEAAAPEGPGVHHNAVVSVEILDQPDGAIEQILAKLGGDDALESLAQVQDAGKTVQGWDTANVGHLPTAIIDHIAAEASLLHHDAVQPVMHG